MPEPNGKQGDPLDQLLEAFLRHSLASATAPIRIAGPMLTVADAALSQLLQCIRIVDAMVTPNLAQSMDRVEV
jgi:hypothetical protein